MVVSPFSVVRFCFDGLDLCGHCRSRPIPAEPNARDVPILLEEGREDLLAEVTGARFSTQWHAGRQEGQDACSAVCTFGSVGRNAAWLLAVNGLHTQDCGVRRICSCLELRVGREKLCDTVPMTSYQDRDVGCGPKVRKRRCLCGPVVHFRHVLDFREAAVGKR